MKLDLTRQQYIALIEIVFAGNWLVNGWREYGTSIRKYDRLVQYLYSRSSDFNAEEVSEYDTKFAEFFPSTLLEQKILPYIEQYNRHTYLEESAVVLLTNGTPSMEFLMVHEK